VDVLHVPRTWRVGTHALEVSEGAGPIVSDLAPHLGFVDELRAQDTLDGALGLRFHRRP